MTSQKTGGHLDLAGIIKWRIMYIMLNMISRQVAQSFVSPFTPLTRPTTHSTYPTGLFDGHHGDILVRINAHPTADCPVSFARWLSMFLAHPA